ncbi:MAG: GAF domain-containing protein [Spirochaetia bacterium]|nr:GAF domain-containing protein [Spirochaetia bacterium]
MPACRVLAPVTEYDLCNTGFWGEVVRQRKPIINNNFAAPNPYKKGTPEGHVPLYKYMSIPVFKNEQIVGVVGLANKNEDYTETDVLQTTLLMEAVWKVVERIKAEEALTKLNDELEKRVLQRTAALELANKELESFSYSVSHDLKAPLRAIEGFSEIFMGTYAASVPAEGLRLLERIRQNAIHMNDLIESLLGLSRIMQWQMETRIVDLSALSAEIREEMSVGWGKRDIQFDIEPGMKASADARLLRIILQNLISNAVKFTSRNKQAHISIGSMLNSDGQTEYFIRDNGIGFDMKYKDKLFVAFQRLHSDKDFPGTIMSPEN